MITVEMQKCKDCGYILIFGSTETCPNCKPKYKDKEDEVQ